MSRPAKSALIVAAFLAAMALNPRIASAGINVWTGNGPNGGTIGILAIDPVDPSTLYAGTPNGGVFKSVDSGLTWTPMSTGLTSPFLSALVIDPLKPATLYAGTDDGVFKSF